MAVINAVRAGKSVFFTGSARTGKSYLLKRLITMLPPQSTFMAASTGAAACHIGGTTLHVCVCARARVCVGEGGGGEGVRQRVDYWEQV